MNRATTRYRLVALALILAAATLLAAGCGIPTEATARPIDPNALDPSLLQQASTTTVATDVGGRNQMAEIFLVSSKGDTSALSPVEAEIVNIVDQSQLHRLVIEQLIAQQPKATGGGSELTNAIPATSKVLGATRDGDVLDLDLSDLGTVEGSGQRLAAAQIVFTATAIPGIEGVRFSIEGEPVAVPLDDQASAVGQVITREDYPSLNTF